MSESNNQTQTSISKAGTVDEIADYWDRHSLDEHWDQTHEAEYEVRAQRRLRITLDPEVCALLGERARELGVTPETLANSWLIERLETDRAA